MCVKRLMKVTIYCTVYDSFIEDEHVHAFRFYSPSRESARSERRGNRAVAFLLFSACGGEKRKRGEDTSRSGKGLRPLHSCTFRQCNSSGRGKVFSKVSFANGYHM